MLAAQNLVQLKASVTCGTVLVFYNYPCPDVATCRTEVSLTAWCSKSVTVWAVSTGDAGGSEVLVFDEPVLSVG